MKEYKIWAFARSAAPNLPALEDQLAEVMREADRRGYIIVNSCMEQKYGTEFWRPALFAMLTAVQQGRVNAIMVQSLDRLPSHYFKRSLQPSCQHPKQQKRNIFSSAKTISKRYAVCLLR